MNTQTISPNPPKGYLPTDRDWTTIPFYRKRLVVGIALLICIPIGLLLMWSGDVFVKKAGATYAMGTGLKAFSTTLFVIFWVLYLARSL